jgi:hypothetical protein
MTTRAGPLAAASYWGPLLLGLGTAAVLAHHGLKPLGMIVLVGSPVLAAVLLALGGREAAWIVRLILGAQVLVGVLVLTLWAAVTLWPPYTPEGYAVMPTGQVGLALLAGAVVTLIWLLLPSTRARTPARPELVWFALTAAVTALAGVTSGA